MVEIIWILSLLVLFISVYPWNFNKISGIKSETFLKHYRTGIVRRSEIYYKDYWFNNGSKKESILEGEGCNLTCEGYEKLMDLPYNIGCSYQHKVFLVLCMGKSKLTKQN